MKKINKKIFAFISVVMVSLLLIACNNQDKVIERFTIELYNEDKHLLNSTGSILTLSARTFNTQRLNSDIWEYGYFLSDRPQIYVEYERSEDFTLEAFYIKDNKNPNIFTILDPQQNKGSNGYSIETIGKMEKGGESNLWSFRAKITVPELNSFGEFEYSVEKIKIRLNNGKSLDIELNEVEGYSSVYLSIGDNDGWDYIDTRLRQSGDEGFSYETYGINILRFLRMGYTNVSYQLVWDERIIEREYIYNDKNIFYLVGIRETNNEKLFSIESSDEENSFVVKYLGDPLEIEENLEMLNNLVIEIGIFNREGEMLDTKEYPFKLFNIEGFKKP